MAGLPAHAEADVPSPAVSSTIQTPTPDVASTTNQPQNLFQLAQQQQQAGVSGPGPQANPAPRDNFQIQQLREQIESNPDLLPFLVQQLASQNPSMAQMFAENPEALMQHLVGVEHDVADSDNNSIPPGAQVVSVTEEERAAIERLVALGFSRQEAAVAYFACDKNEELAANYLFENDDLSNQ